MFICLCAVSITCFAYVIMWLEMYFMIKNLFAVITDALLIFCGLDVCVYVWGSVPAAD